MIEDAKRPAAVRVEALRALGTLKDARLEKAIKLALTDKAPALRAAARHALALTKPDAAIKELASALDKGTTLEKQRAFDTLGTLKTDKARKLLTSSLDQLVAGKLAAELRLDLVEAAENHKDAELNKKLAAY